MSNLIEKRSLQERLIIAKTLLDGVIKDLPSAQKTGRWTNIRISVSGTSTAECSLCGATVHTNFTDVVNYCPHCGADMRGEQG